MADPLNMEASGVADTADLAQGASVSLLGRIAGRALHLLTQISVGRLFGPQAYGLYAIGQTILRLAGLVSVLGMDTAVVRYGSRFYPESPGRLRGVLAIGIGFPLVAGAAVGGAILLAARWFAVEVFNDPSLTPVLRWFALGIGPLAGLQASAAATRISKRMQFSVLSEELTQPALALLLILAAVFVGMGLIGASAATVLSIGATLLIALYFVQKLFPQAKGEDKATEAPWREILLFSLSVSGSRIFIMLITWIDRLVLGSFRPAAEVGIYQAAAQSSVLFAIILGAFNSIFSPIVADLWHRGERHRLEAAFRISTKWGFYLSLPFFVVIWLAPVQVLTVVFGSEYAEGALALMILAAGQLVNAGTGAVGLLLSITGYQRRWVLAAGVMLALDLVLILTLVPRYGMLGAAIATAGSLGGLFLIGLVQVRGALALWPYDRRYLKGLVSVVASAAVVYWLARFPFTQTLPGLTLVTLASVGLFVLILLILGLDAEDRQFVALVRSHATRFWSAANG